MGGDLVSADLVTERESLLDVLSGLGTVKAETRKGVLLMCALENVGQVRAAVVRFPGVSLSMLSDRRARTQAVVENTRGRL